MNYTSGLHLNWIYFEKKKNSFYFFFLTHTLFKTQKTDATEEAVINMIRKAEEYLQPNPGMYIYQYICIHLKIV